MVIYSISDLEKLSGIKAHTIRIWEQRYGVIKPERTDTNIRYYKDDDLKLLLNIALLNRNGLRISKIAKMSLQEIGNQVAAISEISLEYGAQLDALTISMIEMDETKFDRIISANIQQIGFERTMLEMIHPFLDKLSVLWLTGSISPVQESFIGNLIRQKLVVAIDKLRIPSGDGVKKFILYLPEGERQELSLLLLHYLLKSRGHQVIYIGQDISITDLVDVQKIHKSDFIFTMVSETFAKEPIYHYISTLSAQFPETEILLTGYQIIAQAVESENNIRVLQSLDDTLLFLKGIK